MPWNLLILPLLGGYYLLSRFNKFKFKQQRLDRQRLVFDTILVGTWLIFFSFITRLFVQWAFPNLIPFIHGYFPIKTPFIGTTFFSFLIAVLITETGNLTFCRDPKTQIEKAIKEVGNELELLLRSSFKDAKLLEFTLDTDKFYIA